MERTSVEASKLAPPSAAHPQPRYEALLCALRLQRISWQRTLAWREQRIHTAEVTFN